MHRGGLSGLWRGIMRRRRKQLQSGRVFDVEERANKKRRGQAVRRKVDARKLS